MALVSESSLDNLAKNRISFREDLNTRHCDDDGFSSDDFSDDDEDDDASSSKDPDTAEIASMERKALKYRKSLTMLNQFAGLQLTEDAAAKQPTKEHLLAAKKSIDDLTAWVNAAAFESDEDDNDG
ncbi:hypothetical protein KVV02_006056 [Mortierella alpina]|uniref:Uncharacterized protein n=1 Tax=Mortierella alpina TaxID=64518 RepID=A0A9P8A0F3_MORAP|nr:hypothetical protein KVV02_006056 [Mortierella alpina]